MSRDLQAGAAEHIREAAPILRIIALGAWLFGIVLVIAGIILVIMQAAGRTEIALFGLRFKSSSVGITAIFLGAATVVVVMSTLMKRLKQLGALPPDRSWWQSELF